MAGSLKSGRGPGKRARSLADDLKDLFSPAPAAPLWDPEDGAGFGQELRHLYDDAADPFDDVSMGAAGAAGTRGDDDLLGAGPESSGARKKRGVQGGLKGPKGAGADAAKGPLRLKGPLEVGGMEYSGRAAARADLFGEPGRGFGEEEEEDGGEEGDDTGVSDSDEAGGDSDGNGGPGLGLRALLSGEGAAEEEEDGAPTDFEKQFEAVVTADNRVQRGGGLDEGEGEEGGEGGEAGEEGGGAPPGAFAITSGAPREDEQEKAKAVAAQVALWDRVLEVRILIQRLAGPGARLPTRGDRALFVASREAAGAYAAASEGMLSALKSMMAISEAVRRQNPLRQDTTGPNGAASTAARSDTRNAHTELNAAHASNDLVSAEAGESAGAGVDRGATGSNGHGASSQNGCEGAAGGGLPAGEVSALREGEGNKGGAQQGKLDLDDLWGRLTEDYRELKAFSDLSLDRWHRKTLLSAGKLSLSSRGMRLQALDQAISAQVGSAMRNPERLIKRARAPTDSLHRIRISERPRTGGTGAQEQAGASKAGLNVGAERGEESAKGGETEGGKGGGAAVGEEGTDEEGEGREDGEEMDVETYDDSDFYQHLLQEFLEASASDDLRGLHAFKGRKSKRRKANAVDRRASKGRKTRYTVMTPLVNFMAPEPMQESSMTHSLLIKLFGQE